MRDSELSKWQCTEEFKTEAARLAESVGGHEAGRRLGVPVATLGNWFRSPLHPRVHDSHGLLSAILGRTLKPPASPPA